MDFENIYGGIENQLELRKIKNKYKKIYKKHVQSARHSYSEYKSDRKKNNTIKNRYRKYNQDRKMNQNMQSLIDY